MIEDINNNANNIEYWKKQYLEISKENEELTKYKKAWEELWNYADKEGAYIDLIEKYNLGGNEDV